MLNKKNQFTFSRQLVSPFLYSNQKLNQVFITVYKGDSKKLRNFPSNTKLVSCKGEPQSHFNISLEPLPLSLSVSLSLSASFYPPLSLPTSFPLSMPFMLQWGLWRWDFSQPSIGGWYSNKSKEEMLNVWKSEVMRCVWETLKRLAWKTVKVYIGK